VISTGCPAGIGPEVAVSAALRLRGVPCVLVGDGPTLERARELVADRLGARGRKPLVPFVPGARLPPVSYVQAGPPLRAKDRRFGKPSERSGAAQLAYLEEAFRLARSQGWPLATAPVSKEAIAGSAEANCPDFRGHTEWLEAQDGADHSVMCFAAPRLVTSLVTTHVPLAQVPAALTVEGVSHAIAELVGLLQRLGKPKPRVTVCSLNPHAGEGELLGSEERRVIAPAVAACRERFRRRAELVGPMGAETAYRKAYAGVFDGVVAMYHDQATIPMKLVAFGEAVNVTLGLSIVRTSVDHGTGYDIAGRATADDRGMAAAILLAARLAAPAPPAHARPRGRAR
jgi:4-hydroxythreonine-4-phosphate dehydrogenase